MTAPTRERLQEMAHEAGLDWHNGFTGDPAATNRYEKLVNLALAFAAGQSSEPEHIALLRRWMLDAAKSGQAAGSGAELVRGIEEG